MISKLVVHSTKWICEPFWISKVTVIHWPSSKGHSGSTFLNFFCSETARPIEAKFHMEPPWHVRNENLFKCSRSSSPYMVKNFKSLLQNQEADDLETWYMASSTTNVFIWWPWVDPDHFYDRVNLFLNAFAWVKAYRYTALSANAAKFVLIQHILSTQVSDTEPVAFWF